MNLMAKAGEFVNRKGVYRRYPTPTRSSSSKWMISANRFTPKNGKNSRNCFASHDYPIQASIKTSGDKMID